MRIRVPRRTPARLSQNWNVRDFCTDFAYTLADLNSDRFQPKGDTNSGQGAPDTGTRSGHCAARRARRGAACARAGEPARPAQPNRAPWRRAASAAASKFSVRNTATSANAVAARVNPARNSGTEAPVKPADAPAPRKPERAAPAPTAFADKLKSLTDRFK